MTQTLEHLTRRTATMGSIRGIVRTMKTMSAINAAPYERAAEAIEAYRATVLDGLHAFVTAHGPLPVKRRSDGPAILIAFGTDHGLCGNYNEIVAQAVAQEVAQAPCRVLCVGVQAEDALTGLGIHPVATLMPPANVDGVERLAGRLLARLDRMRDAPGLADCAVSMVFMQRAGHGRQRPVAQPLLPLDPDLADGFAHRRWQSSSLPFSRLDPAVLLSALLRSYLFSGLYRAAAEAMVTENAARLARMQQAERAVDDRLEMLNADLRALRQSEITTELLDVIIGFEALRKRNARRPARIGATGGDAHV